MKKLLIILYALLWIPLSTKAQNLFFIGEQSYPATETFTLQSNSNDANDLNVFFAKDGKKKILGVTGRTGGTLYTKKLIVYLDDGTVLTLSDNGIKDYVDETASTVYYLSNEQLSELKESNINTIRYTLDSDRFLLLGTYGDYSASNKGNSKIDFPALATDFFGENNNTKTNSDKNYVIQSEESSENGRSAPYELKWEGDLDRAPVVQPLPENTSDSEATVTVRFEVKPDGTIGRIIPLRKMEPEIEREVLRALRSWRFSRLPSGVPQQSQWGTITFRFTKE